MSALDSFYKSQNMVLQLSSFDVYLSNDCFALKYSASITKEDIRAYLDFRTDEGGKYDSHHAINDMRSFDFVGLTRPFADAAITVNAEYPGRNESKRVYIVAGDLGFGMMRMYQILTSVNRIADEKTTLVTRSEEEALRFVSWPQLTGLN